MISAEQFLAILEERDLLPEQLLGRLRQQVSASKKPVPARAVAKRLIDAGYLTPVLAERLLAAESQTSASGPTPGEAPPGKEDDDELDLLPLDEQWREFRAIPLRPSSGEETPAASQRPDQREELELVPLEGEPTAGPSARGGKPQTAPPPGQSADDAPAPSLPRHPQVPSREPPPPPILPPATHSPLDAELYGPQAGAGTGVMEPLGAPKKRGLAGLFAPRRRADGKAKQWDSSLMLVGGGTLLALLILGPVLVWALMRGSGDDALRQADESYRAGSYDDAIDKYTQYLERFPKHNGVGIARVNRGLAKLRRATRRETRDWSAALEVAKGVLAEIAPEREFRRAHGDLAAMLLTIAENLAETARGNPDQTRVDQAQQAVALMEQYVPASLRQPDKIAEIEASLGLAGREILRDQELRKAVAAMEEATAAGELERAYEIRRTLLQKHPRLANNDSLRQALLAVSEAQQQYVTRVSERRAAETADPAATVFSTVGLAHRTVTKSPPGAEGYVVFAAADGAAYGIEAGTGKVLWRRFVGLADNGRNPTFPPTPVSSAPGSDVLLVGSLREEVLRVESGSGHCVWRHHIGERFDAHPVILDDQLLVATRTGRLISVDLASGASAGYIQVPQPLEVAAGVDLRRSLIFQPAEHSNLFAITFPDGQCKQVVYLGHEPGSIVAPPVVVDSYLVVAVNDRARTAALRVFAMEEDQQGLSLKEVQEVRVDGYVDTPPIVAGRRVLVVTDLGAVCLFEISTADGEQPLRRVATPTPHGQQRLCRFPLIRGSQMWIAGKELTRYDVQLARGELLPRRVAGENSVFLQPPALIGDTMYCVCRRQGSPGVLVSAVDVTELEPYWTTTLAAPLADEPSVDEAAGRVTAVTSAGDVFQIDIGALGEPQILDRPTGSQETSRMGGPVTDVARCDGGLLALSAGEGSQQIAVFDPQKSEGRFGWLPVDGTLACPPVAFAGGLLVSSRLGRVMLIDPRTGRELCEPFQPRLEGGARLDWRRPAVADDGRAFVLADGRSMLYRVVIQDQPKPYLAAANRVELSEPIVSAVAVVGSRVFAVDAANALVTFQLPKLIRDRVTPLPGGCAWGPRRVDDQHVMLSTDDGQLLCLDATGDVRWQIELPYGPLAGTPLKTADRDHYILAASSGMVWRVDGATGKELGRIDTGQPLGSGCVLLKKRLLVGAHDGSLCVIDQPPAQQP